MFARHALSAGKNLLFNDSLTLTMKTGAANITTVDGATEQLRLTTDGNTKFSFPVSLGKAATATFRGIKVVMERDKVERMIGTTPGDLYDLQVPWSVRLTNSGEFIYAASWNGGNIGQLSTSNGCTNLNVNAARQYFNFAQIGDVAILPQHRRHADAQLGRLRRLEHTVAELDQGRAAGHQLTSAASDPHPLDTDGRQPRGRAFHPTPENHLTVNRRELAAGCRSSLSARPCVGPNRSRAPDPGRCPDPRPISHDGTGFTMTP